MWKQVVYETGLCERTSIMTSIFIVTGSSGQYSDHADWNVCAVHSEERARVIVDLLDKASTYDFEFRKQQRTHDYHWEIDHPEPKLWNGKTNRQKERMRPADAQKEREAFMTLREQWCKDSETA